MKNGRKTLRSFAADWWPPVPHRLTRFFRKGAKSKFALCKRDISIAVMYAAVSLNIMWAQVEELSLLCSGIFHGWCIARITLALFVPIFRVYFSNSEQSIFYVFEVYSNSRNFVWCSAVDVIIRGLRRNLRMDRCIIICPRVLDSILIV